MTSRPGRRQRSERRMSPFAVLIERRAGPRDLLPLRTDKGDLKQLERTSPECGNRSGKIESPSSLKRGIVHFSNLIGGVIKAFQPVLQSFGIVKAKIFHVRYGV